MFLKGKELWSHIDGKYSVIIYSKVPKEALADLQAVHEVSRCDQFLMKLRPEFEVAQVGLLNRNPVPSLDVCLGESLSAVPYPNIIGPISTITSTNQSVITPEMVQSICKTVSSP
ncbi:unnamed protein product [Musa banksii]